MSVKDELFARYGRLLSSADICRELRYPSVAALRAAKRRGKLPFTPIQIEGRPGIFAQTNEVAEILENSIRRAAEASQSRGASDKMGGGPMN